MGHIISSITIENFKSIKNHSFEFESFTPLVGYNNAGKSNILQAIKWVLRKSSLPTAFFNDVGNSIVVTATIDGITDQILQNIDQLHRARIEPYLVADRLTIRRIQDIPGQAVGGIKLMVLSPVDGTTWDNNPAGIDNAIKDLFPEPIHIAAMDNAEDDVSKSSASSTIGKLLAEMIEPIEMQYGDQVNTALLGLKNLLDVDGINRAPELGVFDNEVSAKLDAFFPNISIKVHIPTPELKEVFKKGTIKVFEDGVLNHKDVGALGHGAQRSIQMALIRHLADLKLASQVNLTTTLLLIDEPELYLHPQGIEILRQSLKILSEQGYQVVFSTHSPFMITTKDVGSTILVRKSLGLGTHKRQSLKAAVPMIEANANHQISIVYSLTNSSNILFSEKVILAEGKTENRLLPLIIEKVMGCSLLHHKTAFVNMNGSGNTKKTMQVLRVMDLPVKTLVDLDFAMKKGIDEGYLVAGDVDILACKTELANIANANNITIGPDGWPEKSQAVTAAEAFAILAKSASIATNLENICTKMKSHNIWVWRKGTIEDHLHLSGKNEVVWAAFVNSLDNNTLATMLPGDHTEIQNCITWLLT
ncbi:AAA family ATPase [Pedobacter sp. B4-66]|uniref:ATP-dependent nuclease n=1 Tax=Pedobacter sp. B4-66 TaxID=2817280 RepID=UPI001BD9DB38|nr:AAA family ATPase [Pedobacter sp. B4-66]